MLKQWAGRFGRAVFPGFCEKCGDGAEEPLCPICDASIEWIRREGCERCGAEREGEDEPCRECRGRSWRYGPTVAAGRHVGGFRDLLLRFKLGNRDHLARLLGGRLAERIRATKGMEADVVTAVPMRTWALFRRGYNPAVELGVEVARGLGLPFEGLLRKVKGIRPQTELSEEVRRRNPAGAYGACRPKLLRGKRVLLVDDVLTTGATADECARVLLEAGAEKVLLGVAARQGRGVRYEG